MRRLGTTAFKIVDFPIVSQETMIDTESRGKLQVWVQEETWAKILV